MALVALAGFLQPAVSSADSAQTITVGPNAPDVNTNCFPFGDGTTWGPNVAFVYKNIPAFNLKPGDTLAFDTAAVNDFDVQLAIALASTTANGNDVVSSPFTTIVHNTQTPANPRGDTTVGNYELQFIADSPFSFPGGGLIIRFSNPSAAYAMDNTTCTSDLVAGFGTDTSNFFVERSTQDADGTSPWDNVVNTWVGAFRLTLQPSPPKPSNSFAFGKVKKNKHKGTATIAVNVPGSGTLSLTGKKVKPQRSGREASASKAVSAAGTVKLLVKAKGKAKKKLNKAGKVKVKVTITFTPTGGSPNEKTKKLALKKLLR